MPAKGFLPSPTIYRGKIHNEVQQTQQYERKLEVGNSSAFTCTNLFAVCEVFTTMSSIKIADLDRIFNQLDKNGDGLVSLEELIWLLEAIGIQTSLDELELLVGKQSLDRIDFLFFHENIIKEKIGEHNLREGDNILENDLHKAFAVFDSNGDGFISSEELQSALLKLELWDEQCCRDCKSMINVYDANSDGKLDFEEFKNMMLLSSN